MDGATEEVVKAETAQHQASEAYYLTAQESEARKVAFAQMFLRGLQKFSDAGEAADIKKILAEVLAESRPS